MTTYNFTDYPNYAAFDAAFKEKLIGVLQKNELGTGSPYELVFAGTAASGWSFGIVQYDLGQEPAPDETSTLARTTFRQILLAAKDASGNYIIQDTDPLTVRADDTKIADLVNKAQTLGGQGLTSVERALIDNALQSSQGMGLIDASYNEYFDTVLFPDKVDLVMSSASGANLAFLQTDIGKLFVCDFSNQYGLPGQRGQHHNTFKTAMPRRTSINTPKYRHIMRAEPN